MKKCTIKRRYLIQNPKEVVAYLSTASCSSYKKAIQQLYIENDPTHTNRFGVLAMRFNSVAQMSVFEADEKFQIVQNVSDDKRYKNRYLSLFGLPLNYDFSLHDVFRKCTKIGVKAFDFSFSKGMNTQKVLKVMVYKEMLFLEKEVALLLDDAAKAPKHLCKIAENICYLLSIGRHVIFDEVMVTSLIGALEPFLSEDRETLLKFVQRPAYETLLLDMRFFLFEESGFYLRKKSEMPLFFFVKKYLKKENFRTPKSFTFSF